MAIRDVKKIPNNHLQASKLGFFYGGYDNSPENDLPKWTIPHLHVAVNQLQITQTSNVLYNKKEGLYRQFYAYNAEINLPDSSRALYHVYEFEATWPANATAKENYSIDLVGSKNILCKEKHVMKYFISNVDHKNYNVNGFKVFQAGRVEVPNPEQYRFENDCTFGNVWEYHQGGFKTLVTEAKLTT